MKITAGIVHVHLIFKSQEQYIQTLPIICGNKHVKIKFTVNLCTILAATLIDNRKNSFLEMYTPFS